MAVSVSKWQRRVQKLRTHENPGRMLLARAIWRSGLSRFLTVPLADGLTVRFYPTSISAALWISREARNEDATFLRDVLRKGDTYVDCGANIGHLAIVARHAVGSNGSVTAIEANPRITGYCVRNLARNGFGDVLVINCALGSSRGQVHITDRLDDDQNRVAETGGFSVALRPLDDVLGLEHITLLKLDVEGYELNVLRGATRALANTQVVYCELSQSNCARFDYVPQDVEALLIQSGFVLARRQSDGSYSLVDGPLYDTLSVHEQPATGYNLIAVRRTFVPEFASRVRVLNRAS